MSFRLPQAVGPQHYKTYQIAAPVRSHWSPVSCAEFQCDEHRHGFRTTVDERTELGQAQAYFIRRESGRRFTEEKNPAGLTVFTFEAGQTCFRQTEHLRRNARPELFVVRSGDWRRLDIMGAPRVHAGADDWVDDFANHQGKIADLRQRG